MERHCHGFDSSPCGLWLSKILVGRRTWKEKRQIMLDRCLIPFHRFSFAFGIQVRRRLFQMTKMTSLRSVRACSRSVVSVPGQQRQRAWTLTSLFGDGRSVGVDRVSLVEVSFEWKCNVVCVLKIASFYWWNENSHLNSNCLNTCHLFWESLKISDLRSKKPR